jgi:hypothetical protein
MIIWESGGSDAHEGSLNNLSDLVVLMCLAQWKTMVSEGSRTYEQNLQERYGLECDNKLDHQITCR